MTDLETKNYPNIGQSFVILGIAILMTLLITPLNVLISKFIDKDVSTLINYVLVYGLTFCIVYSIRKRKTSNSTFNFNIENQRIVPFVIIAIVALNFGLMAPIINLIPMPESVQNMFTDLMGEYSLFTFLTIVVAAPVLEELIFRGIILDGLLKKNSPIKSILISSVLFGLAHLNPWQFIAAFSLGAFSGWIYYKTKSLSYAILIHAANNLGGFLIGYFSGTDTASMNESLVESYGSVLNLVFVLIGSISLLVISIYYLRREFRKNVIVDNLPISQVHRQTKRTFLLIAVLLLSILFLITNNKNKNNNENIQMSLDDCFKKNIEDSTLMTGWYYISEIEDGFVRQLDKTDEFYNINPYPIATAEDIARLSVESNNLGKAYLLMKFGKNGAEYWREATKKTIGKNLAFIVDDKLLCVPHVNMEIANGNSALNRTDYTKEELEIIEQTIKDNKSGNKK